MKFWSGELDGEKITDPLYIIITNAPDTDTIVPNTLAWQLDLLKSSFSILVIKKQINH